MISDDKELFKKMGMLEVTKVETLRSEIASIISFQPLKFMMAKEYLNMMKIKADANPSNNMWRNMKSRKNLMKHYSVL